MRRDTAAMRRDRNPDLWAIRVMVARTNRWGREAGVSGRVSMGQMRTVIARDAGRCVFCDIPTTGIDHDVPLSRGGANDQHNIQVCCFSCNQLKASRTSAEFRAGLPSRECRRGHTRTDENTYRRPNGDVECRECNRSYQRSRRRAA